MYNSNPNKILWLSPYLPFDSVAHAGGQDFNYFLKYFHSKNLVDIHVASLCLKEDLPFIDFESYKISNSIYSINQSKILYHLGLFIDKISTYNIFHPSGNLLTPYTKFCFKRLLKKKLTLTEMPDIIIMHWTQAGLMSPYLTKLFPHALKIIIEVDVAYQGYFRQYENSMTLISKFLWKKRYYNLKYSELSILNTADLIVVLNEKDAKLLESANITSNKIFVSIPYFHNYSHIPRKNHSNNIIFFGYMGREENHLSAMWFIKKVISLLDKKIIFTVIGSQPKDELLSMQNEQIHILGYVDDITPYFQECLCMVAPLVLGAGIKIKILEGLSFGIPVLTNSIGIEGIPAIDKKDFFYCNTPEDYVNTINLLNDILLQNKISENAKYFINNTFNINTKLDELINTIISKINFPD